MDFVTFDIAKKLKERGFKSACIGHYEGDRFEYNTYDGYDIDISYIARSYNDDSRFNEYIDVPVICQVLKWLRDEKKIHINTNIRFDEYWFFDVWIIEENNVREAGFDNIDYLSYEDAALAGIKYVLDNLI